MLFILIVLAFIGTPLFAILAGISLYGFATQDSPGSAVIIEMARMAGTSTLVPIPLFALTGYIMAAGSGPKRLVTFAQSLLGWLPGGLAVACLAASALFTALTGASGVTIIALGGLLFSRPAQRRVPRTFQSRTRHHVRKSRAPFSPESPPLLSMDS